MQTDCFLHRLRARLCSIESHASHDAFEESHNLAASITVVSIFDFIIFLNYLCLCRFVLFRGSANGETYVFVGHCIGKCIFDFDVIY